MSLQIIHIKTEKEIVKAVLLDDLIYEMDVLEEEYEINSAWEILKKLIKGGNNEKDIRKRD